MMTSNAGRVITYLLFSDIHFFNKRTPTSYIVDNLKRMLPFNKSMLDIDIIVIAGDIHDDLEDNSSADSRLVDEFMVYLFRLCSKFHIKLRILEGTPSHDRGQAAKFGDLLSYTSLDVDYKYIDTMCIETISDLGIKHYYQPDRFSTTTERSWELTKELLADEQEPYVYASFMHGFFELTLPAAADSDPHKLENYRSFTTHLVNTGHVHTPCVEHEDHSKALFINNGSPDRHTFADDHDKGMWKVTTVVGDPTKTTYKFIVNKHAMVYKTYYLSRGMTVEEVTSLLEQQPTGSWARIITDGTASQLSSASYLVNKYPALQFKTEIDKKLKSKKISELATISSIVVEPINKNTIIEMMDKRLSDKNYSHKEVAMDLFKQEVEVS